MRKTEQIWLYWNTIKSLKWIQIRHQIIKRIEKRNRKSYLTKRLGKSITAKKLSDSKYVNKDKIRIFIPEVDGDPAYLQRF